MSYVLRTSGIIIGRTELERLDPAASTAGGELRPGLGYELVEPVFALEAGGPEAAARFARARDALRLTLAEDAGAPIAVRDVRIRRRDGGALDIELSIDDPAFWRRHGG